MKSRYVQMDRAVADDMADEIRSVLARGHRRSRWCGQVLADHADEVLDGVATHGGLPARPEAQARREHRRGTTDAQRYTMQVLSDIPDDRWEDLVSRAHAAGMTMGELVAACHDAEMLQVDDSRALARLDAMDHVYRVRHPELDRQNREWKPNMSHVLRTWRKKQRLRRVGLDVVHAAMGLAGETGEVLDLVKKLAFKKEFDPDLDEILDELGDVGYYWAVLCHSLGFGLDEVMARNKKKLADGHGWVMIKEA